MNNNFQDALGLAHTKEFKWLDDFDNSLESHTFSDRFESDMLSIFDIPERTYVSVGRKRIRKSLIALLIALLVIVATGCTIAVKYVIEWNTSQNDEQRTMDVTFDIDGEVPDDTSKLPVPVLPDGYHVTNKYVTDGVCNIEYTNSENDVIIFTCHANAQNINISIDNEEDALTRATINGYDGYSYSRDGLNALIWTDGINFYNLQGTCSLTLLEQIASNL